MTDYIAWDIVPALRSSKLIKAIATTPLRAWLLPVDPSGLSSGNQPLRDYSKFFRQQLLHGFPKSVLLVLALLMVSGSLCHAQQVTLRKIEFVGLKRLTPQQVIDASGLKIGGKADRDTIDAAADKLMQSGLFRRLGYKVRVANNEATITFEVEESAKGLPVVFENFVWFSEEEILAAIKADLPYYNGTSPAAGPTADKIAAALQKLLDRKNIPGHVESFPNVTKDRQELVFSVKGTRILVCTLHFPGASAIPERELIKTSQPVLKTDYSKKDIDAFTASTLLPFYRRLGHLRAQFEPLTVTPTNSPQCAGGVEVTIPVAEGPRYQWAGSVWDGNDKLTVTELATALGMNPGDLADETRINNGLKKVREEYSHRGYLSAQVKESIDFDDGASRVRYRFNIIEGPRYFMGKLIVNGLPAAEAEQLKTKWTLGTNAVFDDSYVETFRQNGLPEFMTDLARRSPKVRMLVEIETRPDSQKQTVDVIVTLRHAGARN
jgi:outer membrane protein assembly factor BamA